MGNDVDGQEFKEYLEVGAMSLQQTGRMLSHLEFCEECDVHRKEGYCYIDCPYDCTMYEDYLDDTEGRDEE